MGCSTTAAAVAAVDMVVDITVVGEAEDMEGLGDTGGDTEGEAADTAEAAVAVAGASRRRPRPPARASRAR
jgi:hypothetical protein